MSEKNEWKKIENLYNDAKGSFIIWMELNVKKERTILQYRRK